MKNKIKDKKFLIKNLKKTPIIQFACERAGIARSTFYRWLKEDKKFKKKVAISISEGKNLINDLAESQLLSAIKDKNMTAIIFWLKNHHFDYRTRMEVNAQIKEDRKLTDEQEKLIKKAIVLATLKEEEKHANKVQK